MHATQAGRKRRRHSQAAECRSMKDTRRSSTVSDLDLSLDDEFDSDLRKLSTKPAGSNYAASRGEYLNGIIMANYLGFEFIDAAEVIRFP